MYFTQIELYNYGIYKGKHSIQLQNQVGIRNVTLIGGMNGRGKTTLLDAIFFCLYGRKAVNYIMGKRESYAEVLRDHINKFAEEPISYIRLELQNEENASVLSIKRTWRNVSKKIETQLEVMQNGVADEYLSQNWEYYVEEIIPFGIAKFFFFDNEKISQIADDEAFDKVKDSIKSVMGVTIVETLSAHMAKIAKVKSDLLKTGSSQAEKEQLEKLNQELQELDEIREKMQTHLDKLELTLDEIGQSLEQTEQMFWNQGGTLGMDREKIEKERNCLLEAGAETKMRAEALASSPMTPLGLCKNLVEQTYHAAQKNQQNRVKKYAEPVLAELQHNLLLRCEEVFGKEKGFAELRSVIEDQFKVYCPKGASEAAVVLDQSSILLLERFLTGEYKNTIQAAAQFQKESTDTEEALMQLNVHLNSSVSREETMKLLQQMRTLEAKKGRCEAEIAKQKEKIHELEKKKSALENDHTRVLLKMAEQANADDDNARVLQYATMTIDVMQEFTKRLQVEKVSVLEKNITQCFEYLAQKQAMITSIKINPVTLDITLQDAAGGILLKEQLSAGEKQMFAISILWGLACTSGYKLPVVIDTPMARLDSAHRSNFIQRYLPNASTQVLVLSTDEEVYGQYLEDLKPYLNTCYTLVYDETEKCSHIVSGYFGGNAE